MSHHSSKLFSAALLGSLLLCLVHLPSPTHAVALPQGFSSQQMWGSGSAHPMNIEFLPDGRYALILDRRGDVLLMDTLAAPPVVTVAMTISDVNSGDERGCLDITLDPDFKKNSFFYIYYSPETPEQFRVSRFVLQAGNGGVQPAQGLLQSETVIWRDRDAYIGRYHYGGSLTFGPDDMLYLTTGDKTKASLSQDLFSNAGGVFRFDRNGNAPADNLGVTYDGRGAVGVEDTLWAYGLRNGFRATWDMPAGEKPRFLIGEVGGNEQNKAWEDLHLGEAGKNFGWPLCEGDCANPDYAKTCNCKEHDQPLYTYAHNGANAALIGGPVYRGQMFPELYHGAYFFADYPRKELRYLTFDSKGKVDGSYTFEEDVGQVVSIKVGPQGALWYTTNGGQVCKIVYDTGRVIPTIKLARAVSATIGPVPLIVLFNAYAADPRGKGLTYTWHFGNGKSVNAANVTHTYTKAGAYDAYLVVSDGKETVSAAPARILVGNRPKPVITLPVAGSTFRAGDSITILGSAEDADERLKDSNLRWTVEFIHDDHTHPIFENQPGYSLVLPIASTGHPYAGATGYTITLTATDSSGLSASSSVDIFPEKVNMQLVTEPAGRLLFVDGEPRVAPFVLDSMVGFEHEITAPDETCEGGVGYIFSGWSTGQAGSRLILTAPTADTTFTAFFRARVCEPLSELPVTGGLVFHLAADAGMTLASDGSVTAWASQVGDLILTPPARASSPLVAPRVLGALGAVTFDGVGQALGSDTSRGLPENDSDRTVIVLARHPTADAESVAFSGFIYGNSGCTQAFGLGVDAGSPNAAFRGWCGRGNFASDAPARKQGWLVHTAIYKQGTLQYYVDGKEALKKSISLSTTKKGDLGIALGSDLDGSAYGALDVAEVLVYDTALGNKKRGEVEAYLGTKYLSGRPVVLLPEVTITSPSSGERVSATDLKLVWTLKGDATLANAIRIQVDTQAASVAPVASGSLDLLFIQPGEHTVRIWLLNAGGEPLTSVPPALVQFIVPGSPLARPDTIQLEDTSTTLLPVLFNDEPGVFGTALNVRSVRVSQAPAYGQAQVQVDGMLAYTPSAAAMQAAPKEDVLYYTVADAEGLRSEPTRVRILFTSLGFTTAVPGGGSSDDAVFPEAALLTVQQGLVARLHVGGVVVDVSDGRVRGWMDATSGGLNLASATATRPRLATDALPSRRTYVVFDGVATSMARIGAGALPLGIAARTVSMLVRYRSSGKGGFSYGALGCNRLFGLGLSTASEAAQLMVEGSCGSANFVSASVGQDAGWLVHTAVVGPGRLTAYNGRTVISEDSHFFNTAADMVRLGVHHDNKRHVAMDVAEIIAYDRALSSAEVAAVVDYFEKVYLTAAPSTLADTTATPAETTAKTTAGVVSTTATPAVTESTTTPLPVASPSSSTAPFVTQRPVDVQDPAANGLVLRLDARTGVVTNDNGQVTAWLDRSTLGNDLEVHPDARDMPVLVESAPGLQPGTPAVQLTGKAALWRGAALGLAQQAADATLVVLVRYLGPTRNVLGYGSRSCGSGVGLGTAPGSSANVLWVRGMCDSESIASAEPGVEAGWLVQALTIENGVFVLTRNGESVATGAAPWRVDGMQLALGSDVGGKNFGDSLVAEALIYNRTLEASELEALVTQLRTRAGLDAQTTTAGRTSAAASSTTTITTSTPTTTTTTIKSQLPAPDGYTVTEQPKGTRGFSEKKTSRLFKSKVKAKSVKKALVKCAALCDAAGLACVGALLQPHKKKQNKMVCYGLKALVGGQRRKVQSYLLQRAPGGGPPLPRSKLVPQASLSGGTFALLHTSLVGDGSDSRARLAGALRPATQVFLRTLRLMDGADVLPLTTVLCAGLCADDPSCDAFMAAAYGATLSDGVCVGLGQVGSAAVDVAVPSVTYVKTSRSAVDSKLTVPEQPSTPSPTILGLELFALAALGGQHKGETLSVLPQVGPGTRLTLAIRADTGPQDVTTVFDLSWEDDAALPPAETMCAQACAPVARCSAFEVALEGSAVRCRGFGGVAAGTTAAEAARTQSLKAPLSEGTLLLGFARRPVV